MIEQNNDISDTVKIQRPMCCRRHEDLGGRMTQDCLGNAVTARTRAHDSEHDPSGPLLELTNSFEKGR